MGIRSSVLVAIVAVAVCVAVVVGILMLAAPRPQGDGSVAADVARYATEAPLVRASEPPAVGVAGLAAADWIASVAKATGIPPRALQAYAGVAIQVQDAGSGCGIGWNTLAGVGEIESRHGQIFGGSIDASGLVAPPIYGVPLDGGAVANIPDSDKGAIDGDSTIDRAVGPMQLIPESWRNWHTDANGDGVEDPQNIDDATMAAAHYLCRAGGQKLGTESGWRTAVLAYNGSGRYLSDVIRYADGYAKAARSR